MVKYSGGKKIISLNRSVLGEDKPAEQGVTLIGSEVRHHDMHGTRSLRSAGAPMRAYGSGGNQRKPPAEGEKDGPPACDDDPAEDEAGRETEAGPAAGGDETAVTDPPLADPDGTFRSGEIAVLSEAKIVAVEAEEAEEKVEPKEIKPEENGSEKCKAAACELQSPKPPLPPELSGGEAVLTAGEVPAASRLKKKPLPPARPAGGSGPEEDMVFVINEFSDQASVISPAAGRVVGSTPTAPVGACPTGAAATPDDRYILVTNYFTDTVTVIDVAANAVCAEIDLGPAAGGPSGIAVTSDGERALVANFFTDNVSVLDLQTNRVVANIAVGAGPNCVVLTPDGSKAYITNFFGDSVSVVDMARLEVMSTLAVGAFPRCAVAVRGS